MITRLVLAVGVIAFLIFELLPDAVISLFGSHNTPEYMEYHAIEAMTALTGDHPRYLGWVPVARVLRQSPVDEESPN